jgi:hypothetical protein
MPQQVKQVTDMVIDEISLVDRPANQHAQIVIAKRASQGDAVAEYFTSDGAPVDEDQLKIGDVVFDADGAEFEFVADEEKVLETAGVAKSAFGAAAPVAETSDSLAALRSELSKAVSEGDRDAVLSKALDQVAIFEKRAAAAETIAKGERDLRLEREYIAKAAEYNVPIEAAELGPVLMRMASSMAYDDCAVIHKALTTAGEILFTELGYEGNGDNADPFKQVEAYLDEQVAKSDVSKAQKVTDFYTDNPAAYDEYVAGLGR